MALVCQGCDSCASQMKEKMFMRNKHRHVAAAAVLVAFVMAALATAVQAGSALDYGQLPGEPPQANYVAWWGPTDTRPNEVLTEDGYNSGDGVDQGYQLLGGNYWWMLSASNLSSTPVDGTTMNLMFGGLGADAGTIWSYSVAWDDEVPTTLHGTVGTAAAGSCPAMLPGSWDGTQKVINWAAPAGTYLIYRSVNASGTEPPNGASNGRYVYRATVTTTGSTGTYTDPVTVPSWHIVIPATSAGAIISCHSEESNPTAIRVNSAHVGSVSPSASALPVILALAGLALAAVARLFWHRRPAQG